MMKRGFLWFIALVCVAMISVSFKNSKKEFKTNYSFIPSGTLELNDKKISINAFYMSTTEVTNKQYRTFLNDLKTQGNEKDYLLARPDTTPLTKNNPNYFHKPMQNIYFNHPAYDDFPIVNISKEGAELYCKWLTKKMRTKYQKKHFNDFRLPTKAEWIYAAKGGNKKSIYPWGGPYLVLGRKF